MGTLNSEAITYSVGGRAGYSNDIGMVQIPWALERVCGKGLVLEHAFGR
jgi:hypothetical protein